MKDSSNKTGRCEVCDETAATAVDGVPRDVAIRALRFVLERLEQLSA